ncbi:leucine-rich repeat (LRR) protein [Saprospira grandis DSM 2844]|uniref:Leucine-rich repeat (LRR) protein n=1 Tax=Saprospira grandis DSM 2844 TaxID=694433 RepID=J0P0Z2_9BACT|nr:leucine-rich repeat domain-containing protein [Saprospira grandis]EJF53469.1 leucine-rich repeat (LRR) protein [Saprospira grandis DSM 2844]
MKTNSLYLPFLFLLLASFPILAQEDGEYYSLEEALAANPKEVYILDLSEESFSRLPESLMAFTNLKELSVNGIELSEMGDIWGAFPNLEYLDLDDNAIQTLPSSLSQLSRLKTLYLASNELGPEALKQIAAIQSLEELNLSRNTAITGADWSVLASLKKLKTLELLRLNLKECPKVLGQLPALNYLDLGENKIEEIKLSFGANLQNLDLSKNPLHTLDIQAEGLKDLFLDRTKIQNLPNQLAQLNYLSLDNCGMEEVPSQIIAYSQLKELSLIGNEIAELPESLTQLQQLEELLLSNNTLMEIPAFFAQIPNLTELHIDNNLLVDNNLEAPMKKLKLLYLSENLTGPSFFKGQYMPALEELYMSDCLLFGTPDFTGATKLKSIYLDGNMIDKIHPSLVTLQELEELDLSNNEKLIFPKGMEKLPLISLNISSCIGMDDLLDDDVVYEFPAFIVQLPKLESLEVANMPYDNLPKVWASKATLLYLDVSGTKLSYEQIKEVGLHHDKCDIIWE